MSIWNHEAVFKPTRARVWDPRFDRRDCLFCGTPLKDLGSGELGHAHIFFVKACDLCGWWRYKEMKGYVGSRADVLGSLGGLRELDLVDLAIPLAEVRRYLIARYESRLEMSPRLFEDTVASVFGDLGWRTEVTAYAADGGIDVS